MNRFWIIFAIVIVALVGLFIATKPDDQGSSSATFSGDAKQVQADDHVRGERNKKVTLIEYSDFQCPSCGYFYSIVKDIKETYKNDLTFVYRHFPIISIHPNALAASRAAEAAGKQGKFFEMHDKLFESQSSWGQLTTNQQKLFEDYGKDLRLDMKKFSQDYMSQATADRINRDISSAKQFNISGTPTFILNGEKIQNPRDKDDFEKVIEAAIKKAKQS